MRRRRLLTFVPLVAAALTLTVTGVSRGAGLRIDPIPRNALRIPIGRPLGRTVVPGFLGLSIEYYSALPYFGTDPADVNPTFLQLVRNLDPGQSPVLRIGGDSTDSTWWPEPGVTAPGGVRLSLGPQWTSVVHAVAAALSARVILGIQFEADDPGIAGYEANNLLQGVGARYTAGFEIGNEPEFYNVFPWYTGPDGDGVLGRPVGYGPSSYLGDFANVASALPSSVPLVGPATGGPAYQAAIPQLRASEPDLTTVTIHRYPLEQCVTAPYSPQFASIPNLLAPASSAGLAASVVPAAAAAHAHGAILRVDELNSVSCGGNYAVSNSFAASLWSLDTLFAMVHAGADGVNVHTFAGASYAPFAFTDDGGVWHTQVHPLYYGLLAFARAAPPGSRLLTVRRPAIPTLRIWATEDRRRTERVTLINESPGAAETVALHAPRGSHHATVVDLTGPSLAATDGVTLAGQSIAPGSTTGLMDGHSTALTIARAAKHFVVTVPQTSAVIVTIPVR